MRRQVEASVLEKPGLISVQKFPIPEIRDGAMLIKPIMCGICGTDKHGFKGEAVQYAGTPREIVGPYPAVPGHEIVGEIVSLSLISLKLLRIVTTLEKRKRLYGCRWAWIV
jgi:D-arabinose 1-dehydrogenase-like Zn-dependent alcohol dehydrogenase